MKKSLYKILYSIAGMLLVAFTFSSCTDSAEVQIDSQTTAGVTAAHIFDNYDQFQSGDFDMTKDGWKLNLKVFIYDNGGSLVDSADKLCTEMSDSLIYKPYLSPGEYTVVSIADFREGLGGEGYKFWEITNESNLRDLSITENNRIFFVPFETLGIDVQKLTVGYEPISINADIKPATCLLQVFMSDGDYSGWGIDGYSRFSALTEGYVIRTTKYKNNVRFENEEPAYKYSEQDSGYIIGTSYLDEKRENKSAPTSYSYRALLPEKEKEFNFHVERIDMPEDYYQDLVKHCGEFDNDGVSNVLHEIVSNKQYVINMVFDALRLVAVEYSPEYKQETYTRQIVEEHNKEMIEKMVNGNYENLLGRDETFAGQFLNMYPESHSSTASLFITYFPRSRGDHYEQFITIGYINSDYSDAGEVSLLLPEMSDSDFNYTKECLSKRFTPEKEGLYGADNFTYIEPGKNAETSHYRVVLQKRHSNELERDMYYLLFVKRTNVKQ